MQALKLENLNFQVLNGKLLNELRTPVFMKTKVDVVYSDINNWDLEGILYYSSNGDKGKHNKLSYVDYTWLKIVEELKHYNFSISELKTYRDELFIPIDIDILFRAIKDQMNSMSLSEYQREELLQVDLYEILKDIKITTMDLLISESIVFGSRVNLFFYKNPVWVCGVSHRSLEEMQKTGDLQSFEKYNEQTHLNLSLDPILSKFVADGVIDKSKQMILSDDEYQMLTEIRKRLKNIKSVTINYQEGRIERLDIESMKAVKAESSLMAVIKSAEYSKIEMITQKGNIVCLKHTEKLKL